MSLGGKPLTPLGSLLTPTLGGLRACITILTSNRSQILILLLLQSSASTSEAPAANLDLPASVEGPTVSRQDAGQGEKAEASQGNAPGVAPSQSEPVADHQDQGLGHLF